MEAKIVEKSSRDSLKGARRKIEYNRVIFPLRGEEPPKCESILRAATNTHAKVEHFFPQEKSGEVIFRAGILVTT